MQPERHTGLELPEPDQESATHSRRVADHICQQIKEEGGSISFAEYMQHALYAPPGLLRVRHDEIRRRWGFRYCAGNLAAVRSRTARQIAAVWEQGADRQIFELGAGSGVLAATILRKLSLLNSIARSLFHSGGFGGPAAAAATTSQSRSTGIGSASRVALGAAGRILGRRRCERSCGRTSG